MSCRIMSKLWTKYSALCQYPSSSTILHLVGVFVLVIASAHVRAQFCPRSAGGAFASSCSSPLVIPPKVKLDKFSMFQSSLTGMRSQMWHFFGWLPSHWNSLSCQISGPTFDSCGVDSGLYLGLKGAATLAPASAAMDTRAAHWKSRFPSLALYCMVRASSGCVFGSPVSEALNSQLSARSRFSADALPSRRAMDPADVIFFSFRQKLIWTSPSFNLTSRRP
mmetsp:Transcript_80519/g.210050  ORF Transcript_80519/g.210050 Transcript_80519/m.210050 type:complete len:222 (-) Transcript_80519:215-880(-)